MNDAPDITVTTQYVRGVVERSAQEPTMSDGPRESVVRVNSGDLHALKAAKAEFETDVPLGYVARVGARRILEGSDDTDDETGVVL